MYKQEEILKVLSLKLRKLFSGLVIQYEMLQEIRLRVNKPLTVRYENIEYFITEDSGMSTDRDKAYMVTQNEIKETMEYISNYSLYAFEDEIRQGFITIQGGHRVGIAGKIILEGEKIKNIKHISFLNIRLSHQVKGCADPVMPYISAENGLYHTLVISPPGCGKTTLLRDMIRQLSDGTGGQRGVTVGVVDERSEIGACYMGVPQNDLGIRTDILDCCPKAEGMMMLIRSMSPTVVAVDEIGSGRDIDAVEYAVKCGCKLLATVHGSSMEDIMERPLMGNLVRQKVFDRYIILNGKRKAGHIEEIYDSMGNRIYRSAGQERQG